MANDLGDQVLRTDLGSYALYAYVASGGSGTVYFGRDLQSNRAVAIKRLHVHLAHQPELVERFEQEAHRLRGLQHPNIVQVLDDGKDREGLPFIILQWVEGWTVAALLQQHGRFAIAEAVEIASQVLAALEAAGKRGVVHRDIKPANLMVTPPPDRQVKVMDFGIAKDLLANASGQYTQIGTIAYMAPEQFTQGRVDARTDLFALGVTLYELLTGQRPSGALADESLTSLRELRPEVDPALAAVVYRALEKHPMDRFQTAGQMRAALEPFVGTAVDLTVPGVDTVALEPQPTRVLAGWRRIRTPIWAGGVATLLAIGIVVQQVASRQTGQDGVSTPAPVAHTTDIARATPAIVLPTDVPPTPSPRAAIPPISTDVYHSFDLDASSHRNDGAYADADGGRSLACCPGPDRSHLVARLAVNHRAAERISSSSLRVPTGPGQAVRCAPVLRRRAAGSGQPRRGSRATQRGEHVAPPTAGGETDARCADSDADGYDSTTGCRPTAPAQARAAGTTAPNTTSAQTLNVHSTESVGGMCDNVGWGYSRAPIAVARTLCRPSADFTRSTAAVCRMGVVDPGMSLPSSSHLKSYRSV
jgi:hypothetical protein